MADNELRQGANTSQEPTNQPQTENSARTGLTDRDLGTAGGGSIPGSDVSMAGRKASREARTSDSTVDDSDIAGSEQHGQRTSNDVAINKLDKDAKGNLGGRSLGEPQTAMGDRDTKRGRTDQGQEQITDPMTSRDPSKISQKTPENDDPGHKK